VHGEVLVETLSEDVLTDTLEVVGVTGENAVVRIPTGHAIHGLAG
jgi:hypothetical protein